MPKLTRGALLLLLPVVTVLVASFVTANADDAKKCTAATSSADCIKNNFCVFTSLGTCSYKCSSSSSGDSCKAVSTCMLRSQDSGATSTSCTTKCSAFTDWRACFSNSDDCVFYDGACHNQCSTLSDAGGSSPLCALPVGTLTRAAACRRATSSLT